MHFHCRFGFLSRLRRSKHSTERKYQMSSSSKTALRRHWLILRSLPKEPCKKTVSDILAVLQESHEINVTKRTVERDLLTLQESFPITCDDRSKPHGWSWARDAAVISLPGLTLNEALTLELVRQHLTPLLPSSTLEQMQPYFDQAQRTLQGEGGYSAASRWPEKIRAVLPTQPLLAPAINPDVQQTVYEALLHDRQIKIIYRKKAAVELNQYRVHPLAIVQRGQITYLVCTLNDNPDLRLLVLHRIEYAETCHESARQPANFNLDQYIDCGAFGFGNGETVQLEAIFTAKAGDHLYETPLSLDQSIEELPDGKLKVVATVRDTPQLRWWLRGFGSDINATINNLG